MPKNICHKCLANVTVAHDAVQRVLRTQKQWIANVRNFQPNNKYVKVLELVEVSSFAFLSFFQVIVLNFFREPVRNLRKKFKN